MARQRLVNCDFLNASSFMGNLSNKAKLLYMYMLYNADDMGFVNNTKGLIESLEKNDKEFTDTVDLQLLHNDYQSGLDDLISRGLLYEFQDKYSNKVYLIRHWFTHNKLRKGLYTIYRNYCNKVEIVDFEYQLKESRRERKNKLKQDNINQDIVNQTNTNEIEIKETNVESEELNPDDFPFPLDFLKK